MYRTNYRVCLIHLYFYVLIDKFGHTSVTDRSADIFMSIFANEIALTIVNGFFFPIVLLIKRSIRVIHEKYSTDTREHGSLPHFLVQNYEKIASYPSAIIFSSMIRQSDMYSIPE